MRQAVVRSTAEGGGDPQGEAALAEVEQEGRAAWGELTAQLRSEFAAVTKGMVELLTEVEAVRAERAVTEAEIERLRTERDALREARKRGGRAAARSAMGMEADAPRAEVESGMDAEAEGAPGRSAEEVEDLVRQNEALREACIEKDEKLRNLAAESHVAMRHERRRMAGYRERMLYSAATRWVCNDLGRAFSTLRETTARSKRRRVAMARVVQNWRHRLVAHAFRAWTGAGQAVRRRDASLAFALRLQRQRASFDSRCLMMTALVSLREAHDRHIRSKALDRSARALASAHVLRAHLVPWAHHIRGKVDRATAFRARKEARRAMGIVFGAWAVLTATRGVYGNNSPSGGGGSPRSTGNLSSPPGSAAPTAAGHASSGHITLQRSELMAGSRPTAHERRVHLLLEGQLKSLFQECGLHALVEDTREVTRLHEAVQSSLKKGDTTTALRARFDVLRIACMKASAEIAALRSDLEDGAGVKKGLGESLELLTEELRCEREAGEHRIGEALERATRAEEALDEMKRAWDKDVQRRAAADARRGANLQWFPSPEHRTTAQWEALLQEREDLFELARARLLETHLEELVSIRSANGTSLGQWYASVKQSIAHLPRGSEEAMQFLHDAAQELVTQSDALAMGPKALTSAISYLHRIWDMILAERDNPVRFRPAATQTEGLVEVAEGLSAMVSTAGKSRRSLSSSLSSRGQQSSDWQPGAVHSALQLLQERSQAVQAPSTTPSMPPVRPGSASSLSAPIRQATNLRPSLSMSRSVASSMPPTVSLVVPVEHTQKYRTAEASSNRPPTAPSGPVPPRLVVRGASSS